MLFRDFLILLAACAMAVPFLVGIYFRMNWEDLLVFVVFMGVMINVIARVALVLERRGKIKFSD